MAVPLTYRYYTKIKNIIQYYYDTIELVNTRINLHYQYLIWHVDVTMHVWRMYVIRILVTTSFITFNLLINIGNFIYLLYKCVLSLKHRLGNAWNKEVCGHTAALQMRLLPHGSAAVKPFRPPLSAVFRNSANNTYKLYNWIHGAGQRIVSSFKQFAREHVQRHVLKWL